MKSDAITFDATPRPSWKTGPAPKALETPRRIDCGSGYHYGICPKCGKGHGWRVI